MPQKSISRREFLKLSSLGAASLFAGPGVFSIPTGEGGLPPIGRARVTINAINIYSQPDFQSQKTGLLQRDQVISIYNEVISEFGPVYNRRWYQYQDGFVHSAYLQRVDHAQPNTSLPQNIPERGCLGEITVPFSDSVRRVGSSWQPLYRLYYQSVYWITAVEAGPDGHPWYRLTDDLLHINFYIPVEHIRLVEMSELRPISPNLAEDQKRIEISLADQTLTAYEVDQAVLRTRVSTGIPTKGPTPNGIPTDTPSGRFRVQTKMPSRHMGDGQITSDIQAYELLGVPWVCFFHKDGLALHGTYWHNNFGRMMSHGCVNLRNEDALWLYRWTTPAAGPHDWYVRELGTLIEII